MDLSSQIWHKIFLGVELPRNGVILEIAPGYEPKIGNALRAFNFSGTVVLVEPDKKAIVSIGDMYKKILPNARVEVVCSTMQDFRVGIDIKTRIDAVVASHPFDDMVIGEIVNSKDFFTLEKDNGEVLSPEVKKIYDSLADTDYARGVEEIVWAWKDFIEKSNPKLFIASQYPSHMLTIKGLDKRQESGYEVLNRLKSFYRYSLLNEPGDKLMGEKADPKWWIVAKG